MTASRIRICRAIVSCMVLLLLQVTAEAQTPVALRKCAIGPCSNLGALKSDVRLGVAQSLPFGSVVLVSSDVYGLSAFMRICVGERGFPSACPITAGDIGVVELSNELYATAHAIEPIDIPPGISPSANGSIYELVQGYVLSVLVTNGQTGYDIWHAVAALDIGALLYMNFLDARANPPTLHKVHSGDRITVRFADGSSAQLKLVGPMAPSGHFFIWVAGSERNAQGEPYAGPPPAPATPVGSPFMNMPVPWAPGLVAAQLPTMFCSTRIEACDSVSGTYACIFRRNFIPC